MRRVASLVLWWTLFFCLWALLVGTAAKVELLAGLAAAALAAVALEVVRAQGLLNFRVDPRWLLRAQKVPAQLVFDFFLVTWLLVRGLARGRRVEGKLVTVDFPAGGERPPERWRRAWVTVIGTMSPNTIVVDVDPERNRMTLHSLEPERWTGRSAL